MIIRDAIHGSIEFSALEESVLGSPLLQRLRYVKQLATAYLVFPSAQHTRFEHSAGAMHLTGSLCKKLGVEEGQAKLLRLAALLHDVGHAAFAHETEHVMVKHTGLNHEERGIKILEKNELAEKIEDEGLSFKQLKTMMEGNGLASMLTKDLGTDRIDYLLRDAYFTGVAYSLIDADRLMNSMCVHNGEVVVTEKGRLAAESLLASRYFMFNVVYYHPTIRIAGEMVAKAIDEALEEGELTVEEAIGGTDYGVLHDLSKKNSSLAKCVLERKLFKKAVVADAASGEAANFFSSKSAAKEISQAMEKAGLQENDFVACMPYMHTKKLSVKLLNNEKKIEDLAATSSLIQALQKERRESHFILAVEEKNKAKADRAIGKLF